MQKIYVKPKDYWMNDPNGFIYYKGMYHLFYQCFPYAPRWGRMHWGHVVSRDLVNWEEQGIALFPSKTDDRSGCFSGSAIEEDGKMQLYYTGVNYLTENSEDINLCVDEHFVSAQLKITSEDGLHFDNIKDKKTVIPVIHDKGIGDARHTRDPKVWKENDRYFMVLGGRLKGDKGAVLVYESENLKEWKFKHIITTPEAFGYMWECPDYFELDGKKFLSVSPQGLKREEFRFQNIYQSGYFQVKEDGSVDERDFREWDMGFDFYAPQTFTDNSGRRLLIGWMGMPDAEEEYTNKTIDEGWQHCLTVPRELRVKDGKIFQYPAKELERLRKEKTILDDEKSIVEVRVEVNEGFDLLIEDIAVTDRSFQISMGGQMLFKYENEIAEIGFSEIAGAGRNKRKAKVSELNNIRILADTSAVELYLNDGEIVFSTRYYPDREDLQLKVKGGKFRGNLWNLRKMIFTK